jgi:hypothetical protein
VAIVTLATIASPPGWGLLDHTVCDVGPTLGNVSVWVPSSVVAAPYLGYEHGKLWLWTRSPTEYARLSTGTNDTDGNVTAWLLGYENWTIHATSNVTVAGPGPLERCSAPFVAYFSPNPVKNAKHGGISWWQIATGLMADVGLPPGLNGSLLCKDVENSTNPDCGVGAHLDLNFTVASGVVDTCGLVQGTTLHVESAGWPMWIPYAVGSTTYHVRLDPAGRDSGSWNNGTTSWYNYSFPANTGIWQYDNLSETSTTGAGLVFSYSSCP